MQCCMWPCDGSVQPLLSTGCGSPEAPEDEVNEAKLFTNELLVGCALDTQSSSLPLKDLVLQAGFLHLSPEVIVICIIFVLDILLL